MPRRSKSSGKTTIKLPTPLYLKVSALINGAGYNSVTDFVVYVLRDLVGQSERLGRAPLEGELDETRRKLKNLGYL
jgi:hypothetical protein